MQTVIFKFKKFYRNEDGIATVWAMFWLIICFALSGLAIDTANAWKIKQFLQSTADVSSVSAAMEFYFTDPDNDLEERVKSVANAFAEANMHVARYGDVLPDESIYLGYWNGNTFSPDLSNGTNFPNAVRVITEQVDEFSLGTYFLRFVGILNFDVRASSVAAYFQAGCDEAAILSMGNVMIEGQNSFSDFCIYGIQGVDVQASNYFGDGAMVGMLDPEDCGSGNSRDAHCTEESMATSEGFADALLYGSSGPDSMPASLDNKLLASTNFFNGLTESSSLSTDISSLIDIYLYESINGLYDPFSGEIFGGDDTYKKAAQTEYLTAGVVEVDMTPFIEAEENQVPVTTVVINLDGTESEVTEMVDAPINRPLFDVIGIPVSGTTYIVDCTQLDQDLNNKMNLGGASPNYDISGIAIIGLGCDYKFDTSISYSSAFITTTSNSGFTGNGRASISSSAGANFGNPDESCNGDKFTLLTQGSVKIGSQLEGSNFDIVVAGTVNIASGSNSGDPVPHVGSSITAGGDVHISSHHIFNGCGWGKEAIPGNKDFLVSIVQ